jgi:2,3-dihydroxybenzoate-AMP ligase
MSSQYGKIEGVVYPPSEVVERYRAMGILGSETVAAALRDAAARHPDRIALIASDRRYTYRELDELSDRAGAALLQCGLKPLDRVMFQIGNIPELIFCLYGCFKANLIPVCTLPTHREAEITFLARLTEARGYIIQSQFRGSDLVVLAEELMPSCDSIDHLIVIGGDGRDGTNAFGDLIDAMSLEDARKLLGKVDIDPLEVCIFQISGGTTGVPKVIPRMNSEYVYNMRCVMQSAGLTESTVMLWPLPGIHNAAVGFYNTPTHLAGGAVILQQVHDPDSLLAAVERERVTFFATVKPLVMRIIESGRHQSYDLSSIESTSSTNCAQIIHEHLGLPSFQQFGMSEGMGMRTAPVHPENLQRVCIGQPLSPHDEVKLVEPGTENPVPLGEVGEFCARGPYTFHGYFKAPDINRQSFTKDGYYRSGDLMRGHVADGTVLYSFEGRIKDNIDRGSEKISAEEVERALQNYPAIENAAVIGVADRIFGERVCACLVLKPGCHAPSVADLGEHLSRQKLAKFKWPERVEAFSQMPLTDIGKIDKKQLRAAVESRMHSDIPASTASQG